MFTTKTLGHSIVVGILWIISFIVGSHSPYLNNTVGDILGVLLTWGYTHQFIIPTVLKGIKTGAVKQ